MQGQNIICFAKDWHEDPTSNNHVMIELAKGNRVLWLNSLATRAPKLTSGRDLGKIFRKLTTFFRGAQRALPNLWVYTPIVLPFPHSRLAQAINKRLLRTTIRALRRRLNMREFQLWTFLPTAGDYMGTLGESLTVYYCVDEWSKFSYVDGPRVAAADQKLCRSADVVFATAQSLVDQRVQFNPQTYLARHGVDHRLFTKALDDDTVIPRDLQNLPGPRIGFYGTIQDWVDIELIEFLRVRCPEWSIVLIGRERVDLSSIRALPNVHILGHRTHTQLPEYCKGFSVALIPQRVNELTVHMNPIKLREYLSAGLPVVATALPEVQQYPPDMCRTAESFEAFERAIVEMIASDTPELRRRRSDAMRQETWQAKTSEVCAHVMRAKERKAQRT